MKGQRSSIVSEIVRLRRSLRTLDRSFSRLAPMLSAASARSGGAAAANGARRKPRLSAEARAALVLQGRYMGYMRQLKAADKARVRKVRESRGVKTAIQKARQALGHDRSLPS